MKTCPHCGGDRKPYNATCTRSQCQEASYYICVARSARGSPKRTLEAKAKEAVRVASNHPGWGLRGLVACLALVLLAGMGCDRLQGQGPFGIPIAGKGYEGPVTFLPGQEDAELIVWKWTYGGIAAIVEPPPILWRTGDYCTGKVDHKTYSGSFACPYAYENGCCNGLYVIQSDFAYVENWEYASKISDTSYAHELCHAWAAYSDSATLGEPDHGGPCFRGRDGNIGTEGSMLWEAIRRLKVVGQ